MLFAYRLANIANLFARVQLLFRQVHTHTHTHIRNIDNIHVERIARKHTANMHRTQKPQFYKHRVCVLVQ